VLSSGLRWLLGGEHECIFCRLLLVVPCLVAWTLLFPCTQAEVVKQEMRLRAEKENLEKEKRMLMGTASGQDNQVRVYIAVSY